MRRALCAWAAVAAVAAAACADDDAAAIPADAHVQGSRAGAPAQRLDAAIARDADTAAPDAALPPPDRVGADFVRFDALVPDARGVVRFGFDAPGDAASYVVTVEALDGPRAIELLEVSGPGGLLWSALQDGPFAFEPAQRENVNEFVPYAFMQPSSPESPVLAPGRHEVMVRARGPVVRGAAVDVVFKRSAGEPAAGSLDVVLWFLDGAGMDAAAASSDARLQSALDRFRDIYATRGIEVDVTEHRDLGGGDDLAELAVLDDDAELAALLARIAAEPIGSERAAHVAFVERIEAGPGKTVLGKATGLPAPPSHPELTRRGAIVLGYATLPAAADRIGEMLAHEVGHLLGLRHTTEFDGLRHDPIVDTAECPAERASRASSSGTLVLSAEDCADLDGHNLLFYTPPQLAGAQDELTAGQGFVLLHSPSVR